MHATAQKLNRIVREMSAKYAERGHVIDALALAVLTKSHVYMLGEPGTAKSMIARDFLRHIKQAHTFEMLCTLTTPVEAGFGPYDVPRLRDTGDMVRRVDGYLPTCDFAILEEIGKASATLGHNMLAALNERLYHEVSEGRSTREIPLWSAVATSNEVLTNTSESAAALWDRLLLRVNVNYIQENSAFANLLLSPPQAVGGTTVTLGEVQAAHDEVLNVRLPQEVVDGVLDLKRKLLDSNIVVSDRRWVQAMDVVRAQAFLRGRTEAETDDLAALQHILWELPDQISKVQRICTSISNPAAEQVFSLRRDLEDLRKEGQDRMGTSLQNRAGWGAETLGKLKGMKDELIQLRQTALQANRSTNLMDETLDEVNALGTWCRKEMLDLGDGGN